LLPSRESIDFCEGFFVEEREDQIKMNFGSLFRAALANLAGT
jgi:hypothetical protein